MKAVAASASSLRLTLGDGIGGLTEAQDRLAAFLEAAGCSGAVLFRAALVVEEAVMNVLHHGQRPDRATRIVLEAVAGRDLTIIVEDDGPAFDPLSRVSAPRPTRLEDAPIGGVGLVLLRRNATALRYARTAAGCNRLEMDLNGAERTMPAPPRG